MAGNIDVINLANLNVHLSVPIFHRAAPLVPFDYNLSFDSTVYYPNNGAWTPVSNWGWRGITEAYVGYVMGVYTTTQAGYEFSNLAYYDPTGTVHPFPTSLYVCSPVGVCDQGYSTGYATDNSGYYLILEAHGSGPTLTMYDRSGNIWYPPAGYYGTAPPTDAASAFRPLGVYTAGASAAVSNGVTTFTDPLGTALTVSGTNPVKYQYPGSTSTTQFTVAVNYGTYNIKTNFQCANIQEYNASNVSLISSISLADGTAYTFTYERNGTYYTGRIASIGLPTGGTITYQYTGGSNGIDCADGTTAGLSRTTPDGTWKYTRSNTTGVTYNETGVTTTIIDPSTNTTVYTFSNGFETYRTVTSSSVLI